MKDIRRFDRWFLCAGSAAPRNSGDGAAAIHGGGEPARRARRAACTILLLGAAIAAPAQTFTTLVNFDGKNGSLPQDMSLIQATDGNFYGTTSSGGPVTSGAGVDYGGEGTIFKMTPAGALTTLYTFDTNDEAANGGAPMAGLIQASDGNFYGTTFGVGFYGTVFRITPGGALTTLHVFSNGADGATPMAPLVQGADGNLYGTTSTASGASGYGTVFRITPSGAFTTLYSFCTQTGCLDGNNPEGGLIQAKDGNFYGTTRWGGTNATGAIYKITPGGALTTLYSFGASGGAEPIGNLVQAKDGNLCGTTSLNDVDGVPQLTGTVFKMTPAGSVTTLYTFSDSGLASPSAGLIQASDGNLYGTTPYGGDNGDGSIFEITPAGVLTTVHSFDPDKGDGVTPLGALVQGSDSKLYGTTNLNATDSNGTIFSLSIGAVPPTGPTIAGVAVSGGGAAIAQNAFVSLYGSNLAPASVGSGVTWSSAPSFASGEMPTELGGVTVTVNGKPAYIAYAGTTQVNVLTPLDSATGQVAIVLNNGTTTSTAFMATLQAASPGFLRFGDGIHIAAEHADYSLLGPASLSVPGYTFTPAKPGEIVILYADGFGLPTTPLTPGSDVQSGVLATLPQLIIGGAAATVQWAGVIGPGLYQINVEVPTTATAGDNQVIATYDSFSSPVGAMIPVAQ